MICAGATGPSLSTIRISLTKDSYYHLATKAVFGGDDLSKYTLPLLGPSILSMWNQS